MSTFLHPTVQSSAVAPKSVNDQFNNSDWYERELTHSPLLLLQCSQNALTIRVCTVIETSVGVSVIPKMKRTHYFWALSIAVQLGIKRLDNEGVGYHWQTVG